MASKNNINSVFTDIANSIRAKKGTTNTIQPINMAEEIDGIPTGITPSGKIEITNTEEINVTNYATAQVVDSNLLAENIKEGVSILGKVGTFKGGGDTTQEDGLITGEITNYSNDRITKIRESAFYKLPNLTSVSLLNVTSIGDGAFSNCSKLTSVSMPNATSISKNEFYYCLKLTNINIPNATSIGDYAFYNCKKLTSISLPQATSIGANAFYNCSSLIDVNIPNATSIGDYAFQYCDNLPRVILPKATSIGSNAFYQNPKLESIDISSATSINSNAFYNCYRLIKLIIAQTDSVCTLKNTNAFDYCYHFLGNVNNTYNPEGLKDGRIYVPDSLVDSYKSATNWSAYADIIVPLSTLVE